jgi:hypothetical protein
MLQASSFPQKGFSCMLIIRFMRRFNQLRDDFLLELASILLLVGFSVGTVDVLTRGSLTAQPWFQDVWAVVQALSIDVLFFAVWGRVRRATWGGWRANIRNSVMVLVGLLLALVAALVNGLVNVQQLLSLPDIAAAMAALGIDQVVFTIARSILIVFVAALVALFGRSEEPKAAEIVSAVVENPLNGKLVALPAPESEAASDGQPFRGARQDSRSSRILVRGAPGWSSDGR